MVLNREILVDNTDSRIKYTGDWFPDQGSTDNSGNFGKTFLKTSQGTKAVGSTASLTYEGSQCTLFGTNVGADDPNWKCFLDGKEIPRSKPFEFQENNWALCNTGEISQGTHTLSVEVTQNRHTFWLDKFDYVPPKDADVDNAIIKIYSNDPAIKYNGAWNNWGGGEGWKYTSVKGDSLTFTFNGSKLGWIGLIVGELPNVATTATYSIDGGAPVTFALRAGGTDFSQLLFETNDLGKGVHTLVVTHQGTPAEKGLLLDFFYVLDGTLAAPPPPTVVTPPTSSKSSGTSITGSKETSSGGGTSTSSTVSTRVSAPPTSTGSHPPDTQRQMSGTPVPTPSAPVPVGAIVGGVLGSVALIVFAAILFLMMRKKKRQEKDSSDFKEGTYPSSSYSGGGSRPLPHHPQFPAQNNVYAPHLLGHHPSSLQHTSSDQLSSVSRPFSAVGSDQTAPSMSVGGYSSLPNPYVGIASTTPGSTSRPLAPLREKGGPIPDAPQMAEQPPPMYTASTSQGA